MTSILNTEQKYDAIIKILHQLNEWSARQPEDHFKRYGNKQISEAIQITKKLASQYAMETLAEDDQRLDFGYAGESISISNIQ